MNANVQPRKAQVQKRMVQVVVQTALIGSAGTLGAVDTVDGLGQ